MAIRRTTILGCGVVGVIGIISCLILYDLMFSKPDLQEGIILEKIFIPGTTASGPTAYGGVRRGNFSITVHKDDQWIALVKTNKGEKLQVHCLLKHYQTKNIDDVILFKRYEGKFTHIEYFAHNEEY